MLLFPHGDAGWGTNPLPNVPRLSQIDWYRSRLLANDDERFTLFGRLCCEYLVDMYSRTEEERLAYILRERRFRANEVHQPLEGEADDEQMEPTIKLPASFVGSRAWTSEQTSDAMALGRKYGNRASSAQ